MATGRKVGKNELRKKRRIRRNILIGEIIVLLMLSIGLFVASKWNKINHESFAEEEIHVNPEIAVETKEVLKGYKTICLLGVDNRVYGNYDTGNSDTVIVMNINNDTKEINMMSVYRDTYLNVYDDSYQKCNSAYAKGGPLATINMLNKNLDLNITDYVSVDFKALADAVDIVGGIDIDIAQDEVKEMNKFIAETEGWLKRSSSNIQQPGLQHLDGIQALTYARIRKTSGNDFRRAERQRTVVSKLFEKASNASLGDLNELMDTIFPEISTSLSFTECLDLAVNVKSYSLGESRGFPMALRTKNMGRKGDCVIPCTLLDNVTQAHNFLYGADDYIPTNQVAQISNKIVSDTGLGADDVVDYGY